MKIFPRYELRPRYLGEKTVHGLLSDVPDDGGFAVHSVNLPEHEYKRWGEADFVVVTTSGVTLLEVKGGTVSLAGRFWSYENARGQAIRSSEGPARQALSAAVQLEALLSRHIGRKIRCRWGVVFPLCAFKSDLAELPPNRLADRRTCADVGPFADWLNNIPFDQHDSAAFALDEKEIAAIREVLLPEMCATTSLGLAVRSNQSEVFRLTEQQFGILDSLQHNPRLVVYGGAGTGKTELATLCARAEKAAGRCPAVVAAGKPLIAALRSKLAPLGIPVVSDLLPAGTDTVIIDEGQDFARPAPMNALFAQLPGGFAAGRWRWFMDRNLQFMKEPPDQECLDLVERNSVPVMLNRNVRSTRQIVGLIGTLLNADVGLSQVDGFGIKVGIRAASGVREEIDVAVDLLRSALDDGVQPWEIAVLGAAGSAGPVCGGLIRKLPDVIRPLGADGRITSDCHGVGAGIADFRGMEAGLVLLVDLNLLPAGDLGTSHLYVGMSRARVSLQLLLQPEARSYVKRLIADRD